MRPRRLTPLLRGAGTRRCARRRGRPARAMRATAACSVARSPGCGSYESANGDVALGAAEPHFFERTLRAFVVDGCRDAIRGAFAGETAYELEAIAAQADTPLNGRSRGGRCRFRGVRRGSSLRRTTIHFAEETGKLYLPTGNPLPSSQSTIALFGPPRIRRLVRTETAMRAAVRVCAEIAVPARPPEV